MEVLCYFFDESSGYVYVVPTSKNSDVLERFKIFQVGFERKFYCAVKVVHSDNGGAYDNLRFKRYLQHKGIEQSPCPQYVANLR